MAARASGTIAKSGKGTVTLRLTRKVKRALAHAKRVRLTVRVTVRPGTGA